MERIGERKTPIGDYPLNVEVGNGLIHLLYKYPRVPIVYFDAGLAQVEGH